MLGLHRAVWIVAGALWLAFAPGRVLAQVPQRCPQPVARIVSIDGIVEIKDAPFDT